MRFRRFVRNLLLLIVIAAIFGALGYYVYTQDSVKREETYALKVALARETAVYGALFDATRTAEADLPHYRLVTLSAGELLADVAKRYNTSVEVLRMANKFREDVDAAQGGETIIVPEDVQRLDPPRSFQKPYIAIAGETLEILANRYAVPLNILQLDNPVLTRRGVIPGDVVFIAELLR
jgi:hypothetical protein